MKNLSSARKLFRVISVLIVLASIIPMTGVSAQSASLVLSPASGDAPAARGTLSGSGWCNPASSVTVSGPGVTGSGEIGRDGSLSGTFSVTGKAGDKVKISVSATCRSGSGAASAVFKFKGHPTQTPIPGPVDTPTSTFTLTPSATATSTSTPTFTPTFTLTATSEENPDENSDSVMPYSGTTTLTILGCDPLPENLLLSFRRFLGNTPITGQTIPVAVELGGQPGLFVFEPPQAQPGDLFAIDLRINSPDCPTGEESSIDNWTPGSSLHVTFALPGGSSLLGSSLGKYIPGSVQKEITLFGVWSTNIEFSTTPKGHIQLFQWSNSDPNIVSGKLQASVLPFPGTTEGDLLNPPGLVADWDVTCGNCNFSIDASILAFEPPGGSQNQSSFLNFFQQVFQLLKQGFSQVLTWVNSLLGKQTPALPPVPEMTSASLQTDNMVNLVDSGKILPPLITTYYFRVVPLYKDEIPGAASNPVRIQWYGINQAGEIIKKGQECQQNPGAPGCPTPVPPPLKPFIVEVVGYHGMVAPQSGHEGCYLVTKDTTVMVGTSPVQYKAGQMICPPQPKEKSWYEAAIDFALDAVNWVSTAYSDLKDAVVTIVSKFVPDDLCGKKCLGTLLDAGLMAIGLPPSLPNFDQLMTQGLDYLAAQAAGQLGIPQEVYDSIDPNLTGLAAQIAISEAEEIWKAEAEKQIKQGLQQGLEAAQYALSESVSWIPDGVPIKPDPLGDYQPPTLMLKVTRDPAVPLEADTCSGKPGSGGSLWVLSNVIVSVDHADKFNNSIASKNQQMQANNPYYLYESMYVPLPMLALGESQIIPVGLKPTMYSYWGSPWTSFNDAQSAWSTWYWNGQMNLSISNPCTQGDSIQGEANQTFGQ
jgi:hypothetical protein